MEIVKIILGWAIPLILSTVTGFIIKELKENKKNNIAMKAGMLSLIRSQIVGKCDKYMKEGELPEYARYCLEDLFKQYKSLGGNHGVEILVEQCFELPLSNKKIEKGKKKNDN